MDDFKDLLERNKSAASDITTDANLAATAAATATATADYDPIIRLKHQ